MSDLPTTEFPDSGMTRHIRPGCERLWRLAGLLTLIALAGVGRAAAAEAEAAEDAVLRAWAEDAFCPAPSGRAGHSPRRPRSAGVRWKKWTCGSTPSRVQP